MKKFVIAVANGFGLGLSPFASGTCGALLGLPLAVAVSAIPSVPLQFAAAVALAAIAIPVCDIAERHYAKKDDGRIVADEWMLLPLCFAGQLPLWTMFRNGQCGQALAFMALAFAVSRFFDIAKIFPVYRLQSLPGGFGVVLDDFCADIQSWLAIRLLALWLFRGSVLHFF